MRHVVFSFLLGFCFIIALCVSTTVLAYTPPSLPPPSKTVYELIETNKNLSKFLDMIKDADLKELLSTKGGEPVTVFASTNEALDNIPHDTMKRIQADKASLQNFVKHHIIAGSMVSSGAIKGRRASPATANGETLSFDGMDPKNPPKVGDGTLAQSDIMATNGILHIVSGPLVPASLNEAPPPPPALKQAAPMLLPAVAVAPPAPPVAPTPPATAAVQTGVTAPSAPVAPTAPVSAAVQITTSGVAKAPGAALKSITTGSSSRVITKGVAKPPAAAAMEAMTTGAPAAALTTSGMVAPLPATTSAVVVESPPSSALPGTTSSSGGFELFGHKFSW